MQIGVCTGAPCPSERPELPLSYLVRLSAFFFQEVQEAIQAMTEPKPED